MSVDRKYRARTNCGSQNIPGQTSRAGQYTGSHQIPEHIFVLI